MVPGHRCLRGARRTGGPGPCLPGQPGRGGSARHAGLGTPTPSQLGFRLLGLGGGKQFPRKHLRKFGGAEEGRWWVGAGQRGRAGLLSSPHGGRDGGTPLPATDFSSQIAFCSVQIPLFCRRFLITFLNSNGYSPGNMTGFKALITYQ